MSPARAIESLLDELKSGVVGRTSVELPALDGKSRGLVGIGAAVAIGASASTYLPLVGEALAAGASEEDCVAALLAVAPVVGEARVVTAAPRLAVALGYDIEKALE